MPMEIYRTHSSSSEPRQRRPLIGVTMSQSAASLGISVGVGKVINLGQKYISNTQKKKKIEAVIMIYIFTLSILWDLKITIFLKRKNSYLSKSNDPFIRNKP